MNSPRLQPQCRSLEPGEMLQNNRHCSRDKDGNRVSRAVERGGWRATSYVSGLPCRPRCGCTLSTVAVHSFPASALLQGIESPWSSASNLLHLVTLCMVDDNNQDGRRSSGQVLIAHRRNSRTQKRCELL